LTGDSAQAILVAAPGCPAELIEELLGAGVLPRDSDFEVLLPSLEMQPYAQLRGRIFARSVKFRPSPSRYFFSPRHFYWLWKKLWPSKHNFLLVVDSPYQDPVSAFIVLSVLALSGKEITLLFATPEAVIDLTGEGFSERWLTRALNIRVLVKELGRLVWFLKPLYILYFLMFGGLIARKKLAEFLASSSAASPLEDSGRGHPEGSSQGAELDCLP
jgi:hypothetical protein